MSYLIVCPSIYPPYLAPCLDGLAPEVRHHVLVVDNSERNLGVAASWNRGAACVLAAGLDWLVVLSPAVRFGPEAGRDLVATLERLDGRWVVESAPPVGWHLIAWSRHVLERVGLFDENYWPGYGEDADYSHRLKLAIGADRPSEPWVKVDVDAWVTMHGHAVRLAGVVPLMDKLWAYHERKWGGPVGHETYQHPFDDETLPISWWPKPDDPRALHLKARVTH